jgi:putative phosphoribosyl transferase
MFPNGQQAGRQLAEKLDHYFSSLPGVDRRSNLIVVGLPRGGVPVALEVARKFGCPLEIIVAKKLPYPGQPEYAIGAVSSDGIVVLNPDVPKDFQWRAYIDGQRQRLLDETSQAEQQFYDQAGRKRSPFAGKTVIVVDDGIATGMTAFAALEAARQRGATRTIMAAPVMSPQSYRQLQSHCNEVIALSMPPEFRSVGQHYITFEQTSNKEVVSDLRQSLSFAPHFDTNQHNVGFSPVDA